MTTPKTPVVFIHGLWLQAASWQPWVSLFEEAAAAAVAIDPAPIKGVLVLPPAQLRAAFPSWAIRRTGSGGSP